jgi:hypothetical protein
VCLDPVARWRGCEGEVCASVSVGGPKWLCVAPRMAKACLGT